MNHKHQQQQASDAPVAKPKRRQAKLPTGLRLRGGQYYTKISIGNGKQWSKKTDTTNLELAKKILAKRVAAVAEGRYLDIKEENIITLKELCVKYWTDRKEDLK